MWNNIKYFFVNIFVSLGNFYRYFGVIWKDRQYDYVFILNLLGRKLELTAAAERKYNRFLSSPRTAEKIEMCVRLIKKMKDDYYSMEHSDYRVAYIITSYTPDCDNCHEVNMIETSNNFDDYFNKHKSAYRRLMKRLDCEPEKASVAILLGAEREQKAKEILFNTMRDNITGWWM